MTLMITQVTQSQMITLAQRISEAVNKAGENMQAVENILGKMGECYKGDPQAIDHVDIFRNNISALGMKALILQMPTTHTSGKATIQLGQISGWKDKSSHTPADDGNVHAPKVQEQTREQSTREMTRYLGNIIDQNAAMLGTTDEKAVRSSFAALNESIGAIYRHIEAANRLQSTIEQGSAERR